MSLTRIRSCALCLTALACSAAQGTEFFTDTFTYTDGSFTGPLAVPPPGVWENHSGTVGQMQVTNGAAQVREAATAVASEDVNHDLGLLLPATGATWFYSASLKMQDERTVPGTGSIFDSYFLHFKEDSAAFGFRARLYVSAGSTPDKFKLGISSSSISTTPGDVGGQLVKWADDLSFNTTYNVVVSYLSDDNDGDTADGDGTTKFWLNPTSEASTFVVDTLPHSNIYPRVTNDVSDLNHPMGDIGMRQGGNGPTRAEIDVLTAGDTFADVFDNLPVLTPPNNSDFNNDLQVDGDDVLIWQRGLGSVPAPGDKSTGNANADLVIDGTDLQIWRDHYNLPPAVGAATGVPEPTSAGLLACGLMALGARRRRR